MVNFFKIGQLNLLTGRPRISPLVEQRRNKGGARSAAAPAGGTAAAAPAAGGSSLPIKAGPLHSCMTLIKQLVGGIASGKSEAELASRPEGARGEETRLRREALASIARRTGGAAAPAIDLVGMKGALALLANREGLDGEVRRSAQAAAVALEGEHSQAAAPLLSPGRALAPEERSEAEALCLRGLRSVWDGTVRGATERAYAFLRAGRMETQAGLTLLVYHLALREKDLPKGEKKAGGESDKVTVPAELMAAFDDAKIDLAGQKGNYVDIAADGNGGDPAKKNGGGKEIAGYLIQNLQAFHLQTSGSSFYSLNPLTFDSLLEVLENRSGVYHPMVREAARTVLASFFAYRETEIKDYIRAALESANHELVVEGLRMLHLLYPVLERGEERAAFFTRVAGLYLGASVDFNAIPLEQEDAVVAVRDAAEQALLSMEADHFVNPHERMVKPSLLRGLGAFVENLGGGNICGCRVPGGVEALNKGAAEGALGRAGRREELAVKEPKASCPNLGAKPEPPEKAWEEILKMLEGEEAGGAGNEKKGVTADGVVILLKDSPLSRERRGKAVDAAIAWGRDFVWNRIVGRGIKLVVGLVADQSDINKTIVPVEGDPDAARVAEHLPPTGNLETFLKGIAVLRDHLRFFEEEQKGVILTDGGEGTRNNVLSACHDQQKGGIYFLKRPLRYLAMLFSTIILNQFPKKGAGYIQLCSSDNALLLFEELRTTEGRKMAEAIEGGEGREGHHAHLVFYGCRALYEDGTDEALKYLEQLGQIIIGEKGEIADFAEKPKRLKLREKKRTYVLEKVGVGFKGGTEEKEALRKRVLSAAADESFQVICEKAETVGERGTILPREDRPFITEHLREKLQEAMAAAEKRNTTLRRELADANRTDAARENWLKKNRIVEPKDKIVAKTLMRIADQFTYTYINTFNFTISKPMADLVSRLYYRKSTAGRSIAQLVGETDFSTRLSEAMLLEDPGAWLRGDGKKTGYAVAKRKYESGKTPAKLKEAPFGTEEDWMEQWYIARSLYLLSGQEPTAAKELFAGYGKRFSTAKELYALVEERIEVDKEGKPKKGGTILVGVVDAFSDIGTHLEVVNKELEIFNPNRTMRRIFRWLGGVSGKYNIERGAVIGNWEIAADCFEIEDKDNGGIKVEAERSVTIWVREIGEDRKKSARTQKRVKIREDGACEIGGVTLRDVAHTYIDGKSALSAGTKVGSRTIFIGSRVARPKDTPIDIPGYWILSGANISGPVEFFGQSGLDPDGNLKAGVLYEFVHTGDRTYGLLPDTVTARIALYPGMEGHAVVPLAQNTKDDKEGPEPVLGYYPLNEKSLTETGPYAGLGVDLSDAKAVFFPSRPDPMARNLDRVVIMHDHAS